MKIEVVNVGDGASSIVSCYCPGGITLIDCGSRSGPAEHAAQKLLTQLGERSRLITTMIVTHFDTDHWWGLLRLAALMKNKGGLQHDLNLFYPGLPSGIDSRFVPGVFALVSTVRNTPVNSTRLIEAWHGAMKGSLRSKNLYRGDRFVANGHDWLVHWPPRKLSGSLARPIHDWLTELYDLAEEMAQNGYPLLRDNLTEAYDTWPNSAESVYAADESNDEYVDVQYDLAATETHDVQDGFGTQDATHVPKHLRNRFKDLVTRMSPLDNSLSLVVEDCEADFITFGDIEKEALHALVTSSNEPRLQRHYSVMLAPHHGSHEAPIGLPTACHCVSQNGEDLATLNARHMDTHMNRGGECISTWNEGNVVLSLPPEYDPFDHQEMRASVLRKLQQNLGKP